MGRIAENYEEILIDEFEICKNMYTVETEYKFHDMAEAKRGADNLCAVIKRMKKRNKNASHVVIYLSELDGKNSVGKYCYNTSKKYGGKRVFIGSLETPALPHWHILITGDGACSMADFIIDYLKKTYVGYGFRKRHIKEIEEKSRFAKYSKKQAIYKRNA